MHYVSSFLKLFAASAALFVASASACAADKGNVRISDERIVYTVQPSGKVKKVKNTTYEALRADDVVPATAFFSSEISIDKASAPDATPVYRSWETGDIFYSGSRVCFMAVPLRKGKKAKVTFEQTYQAPEQFTEVYLTAPYHTVASLISVEIPAVLAQRYRVRPCDLDRSMTFACDTLKNGGVVYSVRSADRRAYLYEEDAPSASLTAPRLIVTGRFADTDELYSYFRGYSAEAPDPDGAVAELAARITRGCTSDRAKIDSIASWVRQNIRYVAVEHGEYGLRPEPAASVLSRRYGDCKGSASLIRSLLRHSGIDGRLVWIGTRNEVSTRWDSVPSLMSGNHQIAAVVVAGTDSVIYLDGTASWSPAGYIPPSLRGQQALIEDGDSYMLRTVPMAGAEADIDSLSGHFTIAGSDLCGRLEHTLGGVYKMSAAHAYYSVDASDRRELLSGILAYPKKNFSSGRPRLVLDSPAAATCRVVADSVTDRGAARAVGDKVIVDLRPVRDMDLVPVDTTGRRQGILMPYGYRYTVSLSLDIPEGYAVESMPPSQTFDTPWYGGYISYTEAPGRIVCRADITCRRRDASREELPRRNTAIKAILRASEAKTILKKASPDQL